jgi:hypothetical protein
MSRITILQSRAHLGASGIKHSLQSQGWVADVELDAAEISSTLASLVSSGPEVLGGHRDTPRAECYWSGYIRSPETLSNMSIPQNCETGCCQRIDMTAPKQISSVWEGVSMKGFKLKHAEDCGARGSTLVAARLAFDPSRSSLTLEMVCPLRSICRMPLRAALAVIQRCHRRYAGV